jgi:hypothetical protein
MVLRDLNQRYKEKINQVRQILIELDKKTKKELVVG